MCNLYSITKGQAAIGAFTRAMRDKTGNLPPMPGVFPDYPAPIVRNVPDGVRELMLARWGMAGPRNSVALRSPTFATPPARIGGLAQCRASPRRTVQLILRIRRHKAAQDTDVVCAGRRPPACVLCRHLYVMAWAAWYESQSD